MLAAEFKVGGSKAAFFNAATVVGKLDKGIARALSKCGAYVRTSAKSSLRYGKKSSAAGRAPTAHRSEAFTRTTKTKKGLVTRATSPLKELIFFAYSESEKTVVIGPLEFRNRKTPWRAPPLLEKGGTVFSRAPGGRPKSMRFAGNPFMGPAHKKEMPKFQGTFENIIGG